MRAWGVSVLCPYAERRAQTGVSVPQGADKMPTERHDTRRKCRDRSGGATGWHADSLDRLKPVLRDGLAGQAWSGIRWKLDSRSFDGAAAACLRSAGSDSGFGTADGHGEVLAFLYETEHIVIAAPIDADEVATVDLLSGEQVSHGVDDVALDGALEVTRSVTLVGALLEKEIAAGGRDAKKELALGGLKDALLNHGEFDVQNLFELGAL